jgi:hypothetical protein
VCFVCVKCAYLTCDLGWGCAFDREKACFKKDACDEGMDGERGRGVKKILYSTDKIHQTRRGVHATSTSCSLVIKSL